MRDAAAVLEVIRDRGRRGLPLERLYRCLFNPELFLLAYGKIYRNAGAMTPGATGETVDGMTLGKIEAIIGALRAERYRWTPVRRAYIEKKNSSKKRPLGLPTWSDKLVQEVIRLLLEAYYEPQFSDRSHGFRPGRGCHTALLEITHGWHGTTWFIEGDITDCFGSLDHSVLLSTLAGKIHDGRFLRLIGGLLRAGYLEDWRYHATLSGCPQGGIASPVLSNVYLDRLDRFIEQDILPAHNRGARRTPYRPYMRLWQQAWRLEQKGEPEAGRELRRQMKTMPSRDPGDPGYRRLKYCRYADDWVLGFTGPAGIGLKVPADVIRAKCAPYLHRGKPVRRTERTVDTDFSIVAQFQSEFRGVAEYYRLAFNRHRLGRLKYVMERSLAKTLARKYRISVPQVYRRYRAVLDTEHGPRRGLQVTVDRDGKPPLVAQWGGISLARDTTPRPLNDDPARIWSARSEIVQRLMADECELCGSRNQVEVHHIRALKDLSHKGQGNPPEWARRMAARHRKTLVVCRACHEGIHSGSPPRQPR
jgi:group II intron reverse transcriptase/maturase